MQSVSARIWTRVAVSISYDDNHYTTGTSFFYTSFTSQSVVCRESKIHYTERCLLSSLLMITGSGRLAEIRWSVFISKHQRNLLVFFSRIDSALCINHLVVWSIYFISCTILSELRFPLICDNSYTSLALVCYIHFLCDLYFVSITTWSTLSILFAYFLFTL